MKENIQNNKTEPFLLLMQDIEKQIETLAKENVLVL